MSCNTCARQSEGAMETAGVPDSQTQAMWANPSHCPKCGAFISPGQSCKRCAGSPAQGETGASEAGDGQGQLPSMTVRARAVILDKFGQAVLQQGETARVIETHPNGYVVSNPKRFVFRDDVEIVQTEPTQVQEQSPEEAGALPPITKDRRMRPDVRTITTARLTMELGPGQVFAETPRAWEIWQEDPLMRVKRIRRDRVFWVIEE